MCNNKIFRGNKSHRLFKKQRCRQFVIKHSLLILRLRWKKFVFTFSPSYDYVKHNVMNTFFVFL